MKMKDKNETRIKTKHVTSYRRDRNVMSHINKTWQQIIVTIDSAVVILEYEHETDRDNDIERLDFAVLGLKD